MSLYAVARAGAGVNNIPLDKCAEKGIVVFNTPGANANGVKELVIAGMLLASRDIIGGVELGKIRSRKRRYRKKGRKRKEEICRMRTDGQKAWYHRTWCDRYPGGKRGRHVWVWMYMVMIRTFLLMRHGNFPEGVKHIKDVDDIYRDLRLYHDPCTAAGFYQKDDQSGCNRSDERKCRDPELCT